MLETIAFGWAACSMVGAMVMTVHWLFNGGFLALPLGRRVLITSGVVAAAPLVAAAGVVLLIEGSGPR